MGLDIILDQPECVYAYRVHQACPIRRITLVDLGLRLVMMATTVSRSSLLIGLVENGTLCNRGCHQADPVQIDCIREFPQGLGGASDLQQDDGVNVQDQLVRMAHKM